MWLAEKYLIYRHHHDSRTLKQFFPSFYKEYFDLWPPTPTAEAIAAEGGEITKATVKVQQAEERVGGFARPK